MGNINIRAVLLATLAVFGIDFVSGLLLMAMFIEQPANATDEQVRAAVLALNDNGVYMTAALALGTASTIVGGYLAARLAHRVPYFNALAFGALGIVLGVAIPTELPMWFLVIGLGLTIPAALFGAHLYKRGVGSTTA